MEAETTETTPAEPGPEELAAARMAAEITAAFPPVVAGMITAFEAQPVEFPAAVGGKALELRAHCGPLVVRLRVDPDFAEDIAEEIVKAGRAARSAITPAQMTDVDEVARQAEKVRSG